MRPVTNNPGEGGWWVAAGPSLPGRVSQGESREAVVTDIWAAIEDSIPALAIGGVNSRRRSD